MTDPNLPQSLNYDKNKILQHGSLYCILLFDSWDRLASIFYFQLHNSLFFFRNFSLSLTPLLSLILHTLIHSFQHSYLPTTSSTLLNTHSTYLLPHFLINSCKAQCTVTNASVHSPTCRHLTHSHSHVISHSPSHTLRHSCSFDHNNTSLSLSLSLPRSFSFSTPVHHLSLSLSLS